MKLKLKLSFSILLAIFCFWLAAAQAASLTEERTTPSRSGSLYNFTVASNTVIYKGAMVSRDSDGNAIPAADVTGSIVIGCAPSTVDNRAANYHASRNIAVTPGIFGWAHTGFTSADVGSLAYVLDDQTVTPATNATYDIVAGVIVAIDGTTCWVDTGSIPRQGAQSVTSLAVSGNGSVGGTFAVSGNSTLGGTTVAVTNNLTVGGTVVGSSTIAAATGFKIGAQAGYSGVVTNSSTLSTNLLYFSGGIVTNAVNNP